MATCPTRPRWFENKTFTHLPLPWLTFPPTSLKWFLYSNLTPINTFINDILNYSLGLSAREQLRVYILTWSHIIICSSKPINQEDLRVIPLSLSVLLIFESLVLISWTSWFLLQGFLPLAPAPEERMRQLEHQRPLRRACFHKMERITNNNSSPETAPCYSTQPPDPDQLRGYPSASTSVFKAYNSLGGRNSDFSTYCHYFNIILL